MINVVLTDMFLFPKIQPLNLLLSPLIIVFQVKQRWFLLELSENRVYKLKLLYIWTK